MNKIVFRTKKFNQPDIIITLIATRFSLSNYKRLSKKELPALSTIARYLFHLISEFGKLQRV